MLQTQADYQAKQKKDIERVLDMLDRWSDRLNGHLSQKRDFPRIRFRARVSIYVTETSGVAGECAESTQIDVISRNLSQSGMSFIYRGQLESKKLVICLDPETSGTHWYQGLIVRRRPVHSDFWEYGVKFTGTAQI